MRQNSKKHRSSLISRTRASFLLLAGLLVMALVIQNYQAGVNAASCSTASECRAKIDKLNSVNQSNKAAVSSLSAQAASYEQTIQQLRSQIYNIESQIRKNEAKQAKLQGEIVKTKAEISQQRVVLGDVLRSMYVDGQMTTIEMLATSNDLSDYVDKEEYSNSVQAKIQDALAKIAKLEQQLQSQKQEVDDLLKTENTQRDQLQNDRAQQSRLLAYNASQRAAFNAKIAANNNSLTSLRSQLSALNDTASSVVTAHGTCGGGYPASAGPGTWGGMWGCSYPQDNTTDNWNMLNRECVSYTAWMVYKVHHKSTKSWGSAYKWIAAAENAGYRVDQSPSAGSVAIRAKDWGNSHDVGHAMYVVSARNSHDITVYEYNRHYDGTFDERRFDPHDYSQPVYYIHFN